jgi:nitroreductase
MDLFDAIRTRRSVGKVKPDPVPEHLVEQMLEAAVWAPNHHRTEPWQFVVLSGDGRKPLGRAMARIRLEGRTFGSEAERQDAADKEMAKAFRAPVIITVICTPSDDPKVLRQEELAACHAAVQNLLLAAHALGLGAVWRTGKTAYHPVMRELFGLREQDEIVGFIYVGYPDMKELPGMRTPFTRKTVWVREDAEPGTPVAKVKTLLEV